MTGEAVEVCKSQERNYWCRKCGNFQEVGKGQWGTMTCGDQSEGLQGSVVKVRAKGCLQIAQIEIYGISTFSFRLSSQKSSCFCPKEVIKESNLVSKFRQKKRSYWVSPILNHRSWIR